MKKLSYLLLLLCLFGINQVFAQQPGKTKNMLISITEFYGFVVGKPVPNVFITRDDTAQVQKFIDFDPHVKAKEAMAAHENLLMEVLKPYFNDGWKLVATTSTPIDESGHRVLFRYFFTK